METKLTFSEMTGLKEVAKTKTSYAELQSPAEWERMLPLNEVQKMVQISRSMIYQMISLGDFPAPRKVGRASRWLMSEVLAWMRACKAA
jgi:prophage regulatory protein